MPFGQDFNDVYKTIQDSVKEAIGTPEARCFRLDELQPAGRITDRLLDEIRCADLCVADVTGNKPNVMWEVGFAMAHNKPVVIITQHLKTLPFDVKDMQALEYKRNNLSGTLGPQLKRMVMDTLASTSLTVRVPSDERILLGDLIEQIGDLKSVVSQVVEAWNPAAQQAPVDHSGRSNLSILEGAWINLGTRSHLYAKVVDNDLLVPYCYEGDDELTGIYYGWRKAGEYWFARFCWMDGDVSGFAFLKQESIDVLTGAWWLSEDVEKIPDSPIHGSGVPSRWERKTSAFPSWATGFLQEVQEEGLASRLRRK
jgi:hypothetical protein